MLELTDGQEILIVLCLLYLSDCLCWVSRTSALLMAPFCRRWRLGKPSGRLGNRKGGFAWLNPLPPLGEAFLASWSRISFSPEGVCDFTLSSPSAAGRPSFSGHAFAFEEIERVETEGNDLRVNGATFATCGSVQEARELARVIERLRALPPDERARGIETYFQQRLHKGKAKRAVRRASDIAWQVRVCAFPLFALMFLVLPALSWFYDLRLYFVPGALAVLLTAWLIAAAYWQAHKKLHPEAKGERLATVAKMCGCPPLAVRAADHVSLHALTPYHPLLLARLLKVPHLPAMAASFLRDLRHPLRHGLTASPALEIAEWHARAEFDACANFLRAEKVLDLDKLFTEPARVADCTKYCPRCHLQLQGTVATCPDCAGVELVTFSEPAVPATP